MIKIEDIKAKQEELNKMIESYEMQEQDTYRLKLPDVGDTMYIVRMDGTAEERRVTGHDVGPIVQGHAFETIEQAILESKRRNLLTRFRQFRDKCNGDWVPDFEKGKVKYYIYYGGVDNKVSTKPSWSSQGFALFGYFKNIKDAELAVKLFGYEIKELFVEEV